GRLPGKILAATRLHRRRSTQHDQGAAARLRARRKIELQQSRLRHARNSRRQGERRFYGDLLQKRVFAPLGMSHTRVISEADIIPNRAAGYRLRSEEHTSELQSLRHLVCRL